MEEHSNSPRVLCPTQRLLQHEATLHCLGAEQSVSKREFPGNFRDIIKSAYDDKGCTYAVFLFVLLFVQGRSQQSSVDRR